MADTKAYNGWKRWKLCQTDQLSYIKTTTAATTPGRNTTMEETSVWRRLIIIWFLTLYVMATAMTTSQIRCLYSNLAATMDAYVHSLSTSLACKTSRALVAINP